jgi:plastocyanin
MRSELIRLSRKERLAIAGAILALAALALVALSRDTASAAGGGEATASRTATVTMAHLSFSPTPLHVAKGTTVVFSNNSHVKHTATERGSFDTGKIRPGKAVSIRFTAPGTYAYHCTIHPEMHGKIIVG